MHACVIQEVSGDHHRIMLTVCHFQHANNDQRPLTVHRWRLPDSSLWVQGPSEATYISPI